MTPHRCAHCRQPLPDETFGAAVWSVQFRKTEHAFIGALIRAKGETLGYGHLMLVVYGDKPDTQLHCLYTLSRNINPKIMPLGYQIVSERNIGYRLTKTKHLQRIEANRWTKANIIR